jgi:2-aminoethylphosphonate-pyruvate transaminase
MSSKMVNPIHLKRLHQTDDLCSISPSFKGQELFCPGPVNVSAEVKNALLHPNIGHRESEFSAVLKQSRAKLSSIFGVRNFLRYTTIVINGSGSAANESVVSSLGRSVRMLILANGEFGDRLFDLANDYQDHVSSIRLRWGKKFIVKDIEKAVVKYNPDLIAMVHHETSTGMLNPIDQVGEIAKRHKKKFFVDAVSSLAAEPVDVEKNGITFCSSSSNKAIASVCGLSFVCGRVSAFEELRNVKSQTRYLNLYRHYRYENDKNQTPNTPSLSVYFALDAALNQIQREGLDRRFDRISRLALMLRKEMQSMGLRFLIPEESMSKVLTTYRLPDHLSFDQMRSHMKNLGFVIYGGKGPLDNKVFQVANIGDLDDNAVRSFLKALRQTIASS